MAAAVYGLIKMAGKALVCQSRIEILCGIRIAFVDVDDIPILFIDRSSQIKGRA